MSALVASSATTRATKHPTDDGSFKMIVRLWPAHHTDSATVSDLLAALKQYPHFCDEVWFCTEDITTHTLDEHRQSAQKMGEVANQMRALGITPSIQAITVGHPETPGTASSPFITWGTMVGASGQVTHTQSCPRQTDFLRKVEEVSAIYAQACQPHGFWLDDDLRLTQHNPAPEVCYCDDCIATFNSEHGYHFNRESLLEALGADGGEGTLRAQWVRFCQEGLACVASASARGVHKVSPTTHMGLQHVNFHRALLEGYDWNPIFDAFERETGLTPLSRPGHGYYNDHAPRGMLEKGLDLARQIRRLRPDIVEIAPEIEGYYHKATGKSPGGVCTETMYYLAMGATQMSYALICSGEEPMTWYADNYFKALQGVHAFAADYAAWNRGTQPGGIDPYISPYLYKRAQNPETGALGWASTSAGTQIYALAPLGLPFSPDGDYARLKMLDADGASGIPADELDSLLSHHDLVVDESTWGVLYARGFAQRYTPFTDGLPEGQQGFESPSGTRLVVCSYSADINSRQRSVLLHTLDWASHATLPALIESFAQAVLVPRVDANGRVRSVGVLNCTISPMENVVVRIRPGDGEHHTFVWKVNGKRDLRLTPRSDGDDLLVTIPTLPAWQFGWIAVK